jgi:hypothetical protein
MIWDLHFPIASAPVPAPSSSSSKPSLPRPTEITSAPAVADFVPPPPTAHDPYPGYYQLPKGGWAAYDPDYYHSFFPSQPGVQGAGAGEEQDDGRLGKHWDELKGREGEVMEFDPTRGIREAREEEERRSKVIKPRMLGDDHEYKVSTMSGQLVFGGLVNTFTAWSWPQCNPTSVFSKRPCSRTTGDSHGAPVDHLRKSARSRVSQRSDTSSPRCSARRTPKETHSRRGCRRTKSRCASQGQSMVRTCSLFIVSSVIRLSQAGAGG